MIDHSCIIYSLAVWRTSPIASKLAPTTGRGQPAPPLLAGNRPFPAFIIHQSARQESIFITWLGYALMVRRESCHARSRRHLLHPHLVPTAASVPCSCRSAGWLVIFGGRKLRLGRTGHPAVCDSLRRGGCIGVAVRSIPLVRWGDPPQSLGKTTGEPLSRTTSGRRVGGRKAGHCDDQNGEVHRLSLPGSGGSC